MDRVTYVLSKWKKKSEFPVYQIFEWNTPEQVKMILILWSYLFLDWMINIHMSFQV